MEDHWILLGKVTKAHGLKGEVKIYPYSGDPFGFRDRYQRLYLARDADAAPVGRAVRSARVQGKFVLVRLEGIRDRNAAEQMAGSSVYVPKQDLPDLEEDEFYLHQLAGRLLVDRRGTVLGRISGFLETAAQEILVVRQGEREFLVPVVGEYIVGIEAEQVVMDLPDGLLDING